MGLDVTPARFPEADHLFDHLDFSQRNVTGNTFVLAALQSEAPYAALIASKKRADAILRDLRESNLTETQIAHFISEYDGNTCYFCAAGRKRSFDKEPGKFGQPETCSK